MNSIFIWLAAQINKVIRHLNVWLVRYPLPQNRRRSALLRRFDISTVIDIGANAGQYGKSLREHGYKGRILSYEPLPDAFKKLDRASHHDARWHVENIAVSNGTNSVELNIAANSESSSVLPILSRHLNAARESRTIGTIEVPTMTLESILIPLKNEVIMLKIDTQGYELPIIQSGGNLLTLASLIELELSLVPLYQNQALFRELDSLLLGYGFNLVSLAEGFFDESTGELLQIDAIYANSAKTPMATSQESRLS